MLSQIIIILRKILRNKIDFYEMLCMVSKKKLLAGMIVIGTISLIVSSRGSIP